MTVPQLYLLTNDEPLLTLLPKLEQALVSGAVHALQIRLKLPALLSDTQARHDDVAAIIDFVKNIDKSNSIDILINDDVALAHEFGVGVHLGQGDGDLRLARQILGKNAIIGSTCHSDIALVNSAKDAQASYAALGAVFVSPTKPNAIRLDPSIIKQAGQCKIDLCVIGGITLDNLATLKSMAKDTPLKYIAITADIMDKPISKINAHCQKWQMALADWQD